MAADLVVTNVTLIDGSDADPVRAADIVIRDGLIVASGRGAAAAVDLAASPTVVGDGLFLVPGIWESHTHLRPLLQDDEQQTQAALDATLADYLRGGITSVVDLGAPAGVFNRLRTRHRAAAQADTAHLLFSGPPFTGINGWPFSLHHNPACVYQAGTIREALASLETLLEQQPDAIKIIYDGEPNSPEKLPREALEAVIHETHRHGLRALVHICSANEAIEALEAGADVLEHTFLATPGQEQAEIEQVIELLHSSGAYITPTVVTWEQIGRAGDNDYLDEMLADGSISPAEAAALRAPARCWGQVEFPHHPKAECRARLQTAFSLLPAMHAAGVKLAVGSDIATCMSRPAAALREMLLLTRAGIPAKAVLQAATKHAAEKMGMGDRSGTLAPGKAADALLLDANPLDDLNVLVRPGHLTAVIKDGHLLQILP